MSRSVSPTLAQNADALLKACRDSERAAVAVIVRLCKIGEWVKRSTLIAALINECSPETLTRVYLHQVERRKSLTRKPPLPIEHQLWYGASRAIGRIINNYVASKRVEVRGIGVNSDVRLISMPRVRRPRDRIAPGAAHPDTPASHDMSIAS